MCLYAQTIAGVMKSKGLCQDKKGKSHLRVIRVIPDQVLCSLTCTLLESRVVTDEVPLPRTDIGKLHGPNNQSECYDKLEGH